MKLSILRSYSIRIWKLIARFKRDVYFKMLLIYNNWLLVYINTHELCKYFLIHNFFIFPACVKDALKDFSLRKVSNNRVNSKYVCVCVCILFLILLGGSFEFSVLLFKPILFHQRKVIQKRFVGVF